MTIEEAKELIISEATDEHGILMMVRMGDDPGPARIREVLRAMRILFDSLEGQNQISRPLAHALFRLAYNVPWHIDSWERAGATWRKGLINEEQTDLINAIESIFKGVWIKTRNIYVGNKDTRSDPG